jgi:hypothetical protein
MSVSDYPALADFLASWFHQDFDIEGETVAEIVQAFARSTPAPAQAAVRRDIEHFLNDHSEDLEASFEETFHPDIIASAFSGSTLGFLEEIRGLLPSG